jgi:hypothetical protein
MPRDPLLPGASAPPLTSETPPSGGAGGYLITTLVGAFILVQTNLLLVPAFPQFYDGRRFLQLLLLTGLLLTIVTSRPLRRRVLALGDALPASVWAGLAAFFVLGTASALRAPLTSAGLREVALFALLMALAMAVGGARLLVGQRFDLAVTVTLIVAAIIYALFFILLRYVHIGTLGFESLGASPHHFFYGWSNARFFGQFAVPIPAVRIGFGIAYIVLTVAVLAFSRASRRNLGLSLIHVFRPGRARSPG